MSESATIYVTDWCPFCKKLISDLDRKETPYTLVNVDEDVDAATWVESVNEGNRIVPTVRYSDGSHATNPLGYKVREKLAELSG